MQTQKPREIASNRLMESYFTAIRDGNERLAEDVAMVGIGAGLSPCELALEVFVPALGRIGSLWHDGKVSVAAEHHATMITMTLIERMRAHSRRRPSIGHRVVVTTAEGEYHTLGARLAVEVLYQDGWEVDYLGANTPAGDLVEFSLQRKASVVVLSVLLNENLHHAAEAIRQLKAAGDGPKVIVGGSAVESPLGEAELTLADALVNDLRNLPAVARSLVGRPASDTLEDFLVTIGLRIQELRRRKGWSQSDLASASDLDRTYVSGVERGKQNPSIGVLMKLAEALESPIDSLLSQSGQ